MKKNRKNLYAGSQPEERYGLGTRKSLYLDRPTSHGGWPEGEYDPPINDRIYNYLKSMGLVQEAHLRQMIRDILNESEPPNEYDGPALMADIEKWDKEAESAQKNALWTIATSAPTFFGASLIKVYLDFADQIITGKLLTDTIEFINFKFPRLVSALMKKGLSKDDAKRKAAERVLGQVFNDLHDLLFMWGVVFDPADILDALIYAFEGKPRLSAISFIAALPVIGSAIKNKSLKSLVQHNLKTPLITGSVVKIIDGLAGLNLDNKLSTTIEEELRNIQTSIVELGVDQEALANFLDDLRSELDSPTANKHKESTKLLLDKIKQTNSSSK